MNQGMTPLGYRLHLREFTAYAGQTVHWALLISPQDPLVIQSLATSMLI